MLDLLPNSEDVFPESHQVEHCDNNDNGGDDGDEVASLGFLGRYNIENGNRTAQLALVAERYPELLMRRRTTNVARLTTARYTQYEQRWPTY